MKRSEDVLDVFWTSYVHSIYVLCLRGPIHFYQLLRQCKNIRWALKLGTEHSSWHCFFKSNKFSNYDLSLNAKNYVVTIPLRIHWMYRPKIFSFLSWKGRLQFSFLGAPTHSDIIEFSNFLLQIKNQRSGSKTVRVAFLIFLFWKEFLLSKNIKFNKNEMKPKMENSAHSFREMNHVLCELKVKLWWHRARERKRKAFFVTFILSERNFSSICVLS